jgi:polyhydroxyalkanoate synthesis regulator phasin
VRQLRDVTKESETEVRRDLDQLTNRVERLEERLDDLRR